MTDHTPTPPDDQQPGGATPDDDAGAHEGPAPRVFVDNAPYGTLREFGEADHLKTCLAEAVAGFSWQKAFRLKHQRGETVQVIDHPQVKDAARSAADLLAGAIERAQVIDGTITLTPADLGLPQVKPPANSGVAPPNPPSTYSFWHVIDPGSGVRTQLDRIRMAEGQEVASWVVALLTGYPMYDDLFNRVLRGAETGAHPVSLIQGLSIAAMLRSEFGRFEYDEQSRATWRDGLAAELKAIVDGHQNSLAGQLADAVKAADEHKTETIAGFDSKVSEFAAREQAYNSWFGDVQAQLDELRKRYEEDIPAQHAVRLWEERKKEHRKGRNRWGIAVLITLVAGLALLLVAKLTFLWPMDPDGTVNWVALTGVVLFTTMYLWAMRILVRMYLSHVHLGNAAAERESLTQAYIGLKKDGHLTDKQAQLVLSMVFKIMQDGLVKEDAYPAVPQLPQLHR